jgi:SH3-like domain-containing protein
MMPRRMAASLALLVVTTTAAVGQIHPADHVPPRHGAPSVGRSTGLPVPRFASLKSDKVNLRRGPGLRYPIDWVYHRIHLPVLIIQEAYGWRQIRTIDHQQGWVHSALLSGTRSFAVVGRGATIHRAPNSESSRVAHLEPGVIGRLLDCPATSDWCRCEASDYDGYIKRSDIWGTLPGEPVHD